jgi:hypothetical protein
MVQAEWRRLLEEAVAQGRGAHWLSWLHLGVMRYHAGEVEGARQAWERSLALERSPWALRNLAVLAKHEGVPDRAADLWLEAAGLAPERLPLIVECGQALLEASRPQAWLDLLPGLPEAVREAGRVRVLEGRAALALGKLDVVEAILADRVVVTDLREGEVALSDLWFGMHEQRLAAEEGVPLDDALRERVRREFPPPRHLDFRMSATTSEGGE